MSDLYWLLVRLADHSSVSASPVLVIIFSKSWHQRLNENFTLESCFAAAHLSQAIYAARLLRICKLLAALFHRAYGRRTWYTTDVGDKLESKRVWNVTPSRLSQWEVPDGRQLASSNNTPLPNSFLVRTVVLWGCAWSEPNLDSLHH